MAHMHSTAACNAATNAVTALLGSGAKLKFRLTGTISSPGAAVATLSLSSTPFASAVQGVAEANTITQDSSATGNASPVATATLETSGGTVVVHCSVAADVGGDINLTNGLTIAPGDVVTCTRLRYAALVDQTSSMQFAANVQRHLYYTGPIVFANLMHGPGAWQDSGAGYDYWYPQNLGVITGATGTTANNLVLASPQNALPAGTYTVRNPGGFPICFGTAAGLQDIATDIPTSAGTYTTATSFTITLSANSGLSIWVKGNTPTTSGKLEVILPGHTTSYDAGDLFNSAWVTYQQGLGTQSIRTMDWCSTNDNIIENWSDRPTMTGHTFSNRVTGTGDAFGYPYEVAIAAANRLQVPLYVAIPHRATDAYVTSLFSLISSTYTQRVVYVEYANETWNTDGVTFRGQSNYVTYLTFTKVATSVSGSTFTRTAHGYSNDKILRGWESAYDRLNSSIETGGNFWILKQGQQLYVNVLTANTFQLRDQAGGAGNLVTAGTNVTTCYLVDPAEVGKTADLNGNHGLRSKAIWDIADAALGSSRVKAVMGSFQGDPTITTARMSATGAGARTDHVCIAPYFIGYTVGGAIDRASTQFTPKFYSSEGMFGDSVTTTAYFRVYAAGSTPRVDQIKAGTGTGYIGGSSATIGYGSRTGVTVTITNASPAILTWDSPTVNDTIVSFTTTGALPTGLSTGTSYYMVNCSGNTAQLSLTPQSSASPINTSSAGSGVHTASAAYSASSLIPFATVTGLSNGTTYKVYFCAVESNGYTWTWNQNVAASASSDTVDVPDTYANHTRRTSVYIDANSGRVVGEHKAAAQAINAATTVICYEGGNHQSDSRPTAINTWWEAWVEDASYAELLRQYLYEVAAADCKSFYVYQDQGMTGPWSLADNTYDTSDLRYQAVAKFKGYIPKYTAVSYSTINAGDITSAPTLPYTVYTFSETNRSFEILSGDDEGNYTFVGPALKMVGTTNINFAATNVRNLKVRATDGFTFAVFTVSINEGVAPIYELDANIAWDKDSDTDAAVMNPTICLNTLLENSGTSTSATRDGSGWWCMNDVSAYGNPNALISTMTYNTTVWGMLWVGKRNTQANQRNLIFVGFNTTDFTGFKSSSDGASLVWSWYDAASVEVLDSVDWSDGNPVVAWHLFDGPNNKYYRGKNQSLLSGYASGIALPATRHTSVDQSMELYQSNVKHGAFEIVSRPGMTLAQWLAIVQKYQTAFSIP